MCIGGRAALTTTPQTQKRRVIMVSKEKVICEICGKEKKLAKMLEYYIDKRSNAHKIMYRCKNHSEE